MRASAVLGLLLASTPAWGQNRTIEFNRDIRPILSAACYLCHGPAKGARKAGRRFDTQEGAFVDLDGHKAIVPGNRKQSHLWLRITEAEPDKRMQPPNSGRQPTI